jgi:hypothetical protein
MPAWITSLLRELVSDPIRLLQHHHLVTGLGQRPRHCQPDRTGADNDGPHIRGHGESLPDQAAARGTLGLLRAGVNFPLAMNK